MHTPEKFLFPEFERINWHAGVRLVQELHECRSNSSKCHVALLAGAKALVSALKTWNVRHPENIPSVVDSHKLLKELAKEIRFTERYYNQLNPPKPERESKRKKRKPVNKDFVDFSSLRDEPSCRNSPKSVLKKETPGQPPTLKLLLPKSYSNLDIVRDCSVDSKVFEDEPPKKEMLDCDDTTVSRPPLKLTLPKTSVMFPCEPNPALPQHSNIFLQPDKYLMHDIKPSNTTSSPKIRKKSASTSEKFKVEEKPYFDEIAHQGGTVLRFKRSSKDAVDKKANQSDSVYDFHEDSDEDCLKIDENPKKGSRPHHNVNAASQMFPHNMEVAGEVDVVTDTPKNGIEELLKASCYTQETPEFAESGAGAGRAGRASPSTREAIAGMLSIGRALLPSGPPGSGPPGPPQGPSQTPSKMHPSRSRAHAKHAADDLIENMDRVHQDDDYIYPSLDASDDEETVFRPRGKRATDEAWNPKARVGPIGPKVNRPAREGAKKQAVEKGLEAAAAKRANLPPPKRPYNRKTHKSARDAPPLKPLLASVPSTSAVSPCNRGAGLVARPVPAAADSPSPKKLKVRTHKKGMATAKQRLGKILKIHKMIH